MLIKAVKRLLANISGKLPLRTVLTVPFILQTASAVGMVGYLSFRNGQQAVNELGNQLMGEVSDRVNQNLQVYFTTPHQLNQSKLDAIELGLLNLEDLQPWEKYLWRQVQLYPYIAFTGITNYKGNYRSGEKLSNGELVVNVIDEYTRPDFYTYNTNNLGDRTTLAVITKNINPLTHSNYINAVKAGKPTWSLVYTSLLAPTLMLSALQPVYDRNNQMKGVLISTLRLDYLGEFLNSLKISKTGQIFIIQADGTLLATSTGEQTFQIQNNQKKLFQAIESSNLLTKATAKYLKKQIDDYKTSRQFDFKIKGKRQFVKVQPFRDGNGLDLLIVVVVPEADFMEQINANTHTTILFSLAALTVVVIIGISTSGWVIKPILRLNKAAKDIAKGDWNKPVEIQRADQLGQLANSFNTMAEQLQKYFSLLEAKNIKLLESESRLKQLLEAIPLGVFVVNAAGKTYYVNSHAQELLGKQILNSNSIEQLQEFYQVYIAGTDQLYPDDRLPIKRALQGESVSIDDIEIHGNNKVIPLEVLTSPIYNEQGEVAYAIAAFINITERKRIEAERQKFIEDMFELNCNLELALEAELNLSQAATRFVPNQFLSLLGHQSLSHVNLGDQVQQEMSILFADIRDFTSLSEAMTPQENFNFINDYLSQMEPAIAQNNGFIDKYIGDAIMALFSRSADDAVKGGIAMLKQLVDFNLHRVKSGDAPIRIGIGINTGSLILGTVGGNNRMDGTVIGDAVNLASRVEGLTKFYGTPMLITHHTFLQLNEPIYAIRPLEHVTVKGKAEFVMIYEVFEADPPEIREKKLETYQIFLTALYQYRLGKIREAEKLFTDCLRKNPMDKVAQIYLKRCQEYSLKFVNDLQLQSINNSTD